MLSDQVIFSYSPFIVRYSYPLAKPAPQLGTFRSLDKPDGRCAVVLLLNLLVRIKSSDFCPCTFLPVHLHLCVVSLRFVAGRYFTLEETLSPFALSWHISSIKIVLRLSTFTLFVPSIYALHIALLRFALSLTLPGAFWSAPESVVPCLHRYTVSYAVVRIRHLAIAKQRTKSLEITIGTR